MPYFAIRCLKGREKRVKEDIEMLRDQRISSIEIFKDYPEIVVIEVERKIDALSITSQLKNVRGIYHDPLSNEDLERFRKPRKPQIRIGDVIEIIQGPFRGAEAKVTDINNQTISIILLDSTYNIPIKMSYDYIKIKKAGEKRTWMKQ